MSKNIFYKVGDEIIYNNLSARRKAHSTGKNITFHAYDLEYSQYDWSKEPEGTWEAWCLERALKLRSQYNKLCLLFSAGSDSSDILRIFLENNIRIDELIIFKHLHNPVRRMEADTMVIPMAKLYQQFDPVMKVSVHEIGSSIYNEWHGTTDWLEGSYSMTGQMNMGACIYSWLTDKFCGNNYQNNTGYIMGLEKPKLIIEDGWWTSRIIDKIFDYMDLGENNIVQFYLAPDMPQFYIKQCWELINYVENNFSVINMDLMNSIYAHGSSNFHHYLNGSRRQIYQGIASPISIRNGSNKIKNLNDPGVQGLHSTAKTESWKSYGLWNEITTNLQKNESMLFRDGLVSNGLIPVWSKGFKLKKVKNIQ